MFPLQFSDDNLFSFKVTNDETSLLWHQRFGHINYGSLIYMHTHDLVRGLPNINKIDKICEGFIMGKHSREAFPQEMVWRAEIPLELTHSDVCGPMKIPSIGGSIYMLTFIDDFNKKTWVYFLKYKSEVFASFKTFKTFVEKQSGFIIKALRSNCGGEYTSHFF